MDNHYIIEINTKAFGTSGRFFPNSRYFELIRQYNPMVLINSDTHFPHLIDSGRNDAIEILLNKK